jgi:PTH1 family peptidyl-tRNA hydrolase
MKLVVGLGNPGRKYQGTRHNVGFEVLTLVAARQAAAPVSARFRGELTEYRTASGPVLLLCPTTYMNRSGACVRAAIEFYKLPLSELLLVCDDFNLPLGRLRFRAQGSAGGQKGLTDVIQQLGSNQFARLRFGIGAPPPEWDGADYVLSRFSADERTTVTASVELAARGVVDWVEHGVEFCMNRYNSEKNPINDQQSDQS